MALNVAGKIPGLEGLVDKVFQNSELTREEKEFSDRYGPILAYIMQDWDGKCPRRILGLEYIGLLYIGKAGAKSFDSNEFIELASGLGLISVNQDQISLTQHGKKLAKRYY